MKTLVSAFQMSQTQCASRAFDDSNAKQGLSVGETAKVLSMRPANLHSGYEGAHLC